MGLKMLQNSQTTPQIFKIPVILPLFDSVLFFAGAACGAVGNHAIDKGVAERRITPLTHIVSTEIHVLLHPAWETCVFFFK
jgi:hypothetical protein